MHSNKIKCFSSAPASLGGRHLSHTQDVMETGEAKKTEAFQRSNYPLYIHLFKCPCWRDYDLDLVLAVPTVLRPVLCSYNEQQ
ncbi:hypothetical protein ACRRTK_010319 [Alexandromys fortis]